MRARLFNVSLGAEGDVVTARQRARYLARLLGFDSQDQTRIATAVSEIARNAVTYGKGGRAEFFIEGATDPQLLVIEIVDNGPGIAALDEVLSGRYRSSAGIGRGIVGAQRLLDGFHVETSAQGTRVMLTKMFPRGASYLRESDLSRLVAELQAHVRMTPASLLDEIKQQERELVDALQELEDKQKELARLNAELFDTNRGVLALYAELDEKADHLRRADELKTRFLSNMSHEFRTPLNSILALTRLLLDRTDGDLTAEQERQVGYVRSSANDLLELVNDLLDLAKVEAGKVIIRPARFSIDNLFAGLRGLLRPLLVSSTVDLIFEEASGLPELLGDEAKVSQILRNFLSNALKFTERGEIRVSARFVPAGERCEEMSEALELDSLILCVRDTGIGIAAEDHERIFEEFSQIEHELQTRVKGTGLGLPLCRRLATLLGGKVWVRSAPGQGSSFFLQIPQSYRQLSEQPAEVSVESTATAALLPVLVVEDRPEDRAIIEAHLRGSAFTVLATNRLASARGYLSTVEPVAVILDIRLGGEEVWRFLPEIKRLGVPVIVTSSLNEPQKGMALGADAYGVKPIEREWLLDSLYRVVLLPKLRGVLVADDDARARALLRLFLEPYCQNVLEAENGRQALDIVNSMQPDLLVLDLVMPILDGMAVLTELRNQQLTRELPILVCTSKTWTVDELDRLAKYEAHLLSKSQLEREALIRAVAFALGRRSHARDATNDSYAAAGSS